MKRDQWTLLIVVGALMGVLVLYALLKPQPEQPLSLTDPSQWHTDERLMAETVEHLQQVGYELESLTTPGDAERPGLSGCVALIGEIAQPDVTMRYSVPAEERDASTEALIEELGERGWMEDGDGPDGRSILEAEGRRVLHRRFDGWEAELDIRATAAAEEDGEATMEIALTGMIEDAEPCTPR